MQRLSQDIARGRIGRALTVAAALLCATALSQPNVAYAHGGGGVPRGLGRISWRPVSWWDYRLWLLSVLRLRRLGLRPTLLPDLVLLRRSGGLLPLCHPVQYRVAGGAGQLTSGLKQGREPMARDPTSRAPGWLHWTSGLLLIVAGCAESPGPAQGIFMRNPWGTT